MFFPKNIVSTCFCIYIFIIMDTCLVHIHFQNTCTIIDPCKL